MFEAGDTWIPASPSFVGAVYNRGFYVFFGGIHLQQDGLKNGWLDYNFPIGFRPIFRGFCC